MPAVESHTGLLKQTIPHYNKRNFVNISNTKPQYTAFPAIQRNAKKAMKRLTRTGAETLVNFGLPVHVHAFGGYQLEWNVQVTKMNTFEWVGMDDPVSIDRRDHQVRANVPWRMCRNHWSYNKREMAACRGEEELTNLITSRSLACDQDFADAFENWFWGTPPTSTDDKTAYPLRYWIFTEPESTVGSYSTFTSALQAGQGNFLNVNHNDHTGGPGGISRATYQQWGNWNCQYTNMTDTDAVELFTYAALAVGFQSPVDFPNLVKEPMQAAYTTTANKIIQARLARQQNDRNASDLVARWGDAELFRVPWYRVPQLDSSDFSLYSSSNKDVVYLLDWSTIYWTSTEGFTLKDEILPPSREAPLAYTHVRYLDGNLVCYEPRRNAVLSK